MYKPPPQKNNNNKPPGIIFGTIKLNIMLNLGGRDFLTYTVCPAVYVHRLADHKTSKKIKKSAIKTGCEQKILKNYNIFIACL